MIRVAVVGLGKMGISHLAIIGAHAGVEVAAVCDGSEYVVDVLAKYTGVRTYTDYARMLDEVPLDAVILATPSRAHVEMVRAALTKGVHVFCEKPFTLDWREARDLANLAADKQLVNQVGYHCRFIGAFQEIKRLIDAGVIGKISHVLAEAYGPVILKPSGSTWRSQKSEGGGCLYDYAAHPINLVNWYFGMPKLVQGAALKRIYHDVRQQRSHLRRSAGDTGLSPRRRQRAGRLSQRLERALHDRADRAGRLLSPRRGVFLAA
jgi:predicted dehydrogenase